MASPPLSIKLRCTSWNQLAAIYERDLKRSAVFLKSAAPPPLGTPVRINLTLPTQTLIILNGTIEQHIGAGELNGRGPGVDIQLHSVPQSAMWIIESALDAARREEAAGSRESSREAQSDANLADGEKFVAAEEELLAALSQELESLRKLNPFQVLGVGYETTDDEIRAAFATLTKRYHPDRFARYESSDARRVAAEIFIVIRNAYEQVEKAERRALLAQQLQNRRITPRPIRPAPPPIRREPPAASPPPAENQAPGEESAPAIARPPVPAAAAEPARAGAPASPASQSHDAATRAVEDDGQNSDEDSGISYVTAHSLLEEGRYDEALKVFKLAARRNPGDQSARIGLELAEGLKALAARDRLEAAQRFEAVLEMDPENERAARELAEMRRQATAERKNLLSRLLQQKD